MSAFTYFAIATAAFVAIDAAYTAGQRGESGWFGFIVAMLIILVASAGEVWGV